MNLKDWLVKAALFSLLIMLPVGLILTLMSLILVENVLVGVILYTMGSLIFTSGGIWWYFDEAK